MDVSGGKSTRKNLRGPYRCRLDLGNLGQVVLVVDTIAQNVAKGSQCALQSICCPFFLGLLEGSCFALAVLDVAVADIL